MLSQSHFVSYASLVYTHTPYSLIKQPFILFINVKYKIYDRNCKVKYIFQLHASEAQYECEARPWLGLLFLSLLPCICFDVFNLRYHKKIIQKFIVRLCLLWSSLPSFFHISHLLSNKAFIDKAPSSDCFVAIGQGREEKPRTEGNIMAALPNHLAWFFLCWFYKLRRDNYLFNILKLQPDNCPTMLSLIYLSKSSFFTLKLNSSGTIYQPTEAPDNPLA